MLCNLNYNLRDNLNYFMRFLILKKKKSYIITLTSKDRYACFEFFLKIQIKKIGIFF